MKEEADFSRQVKEMINRVDNPDNQKYEAMVDKMDIHHFRAFNFLPDMVMSILRFTARETVEETIGGHNTGEQFFSFAFCNLFNALYNQKPKIASGVEGCIPSNLVIYSSSIKQKVLYREGEVINYLTIYVNRDYLFDLLKADADDFRFLFSGKQSFFIDEFLTGDMLRIVNNIVNPPTDQVLEDFYFKLKAFELLFALFESLKKRSKAKPLPLMQPDLEAVYRVRDAITSSLSGFPPLKELTKIGGMNETKMRKLFTQVFGKGFFDYFQHVRIGEAARLLREEKLSVSEVGYKLGFENLSHFSKLFKQYTGELPSQYVKAWAS